MTVSSYAFSISASDFSSYVSEHTGYHHGEASLHSTIVNMAQDFVGANNVPLLVPSGQFGTRLEGGKDAASARYASHLLLHLSLSLIAETLDALRLDRVDLHVAAANNASPLPGGGRRPPEVPR